MFFNRLNKTYLHGLNLKRIEEYIVSTIEYVIIWIFLEQLF